MIPRLLGMIAVVAWAPSIAAAALPPTAAVADQFFGTWTGEITAPNARTAFGLSFTPTNNGLLVRVNFPEMFLYGANFGPANFVGETFQLEALNLELNYTHDTLTGTFAQARLPVRLHRGGSFAPEPAETALPPAPAPSWTHVLGAPVWASPVAREGIVYVGTTDGKFHAVRAADGSALWAWTGAHACYGTAAIGQDAVYFLDQQMELIALNRADGTPRWRTSLFDERIAGARLDRDETFNHRAATPVLDGRGILHVGSTDGGLYSVRSDTGKVVWCHPSKTRIYAPVNVGQDHIVAAGFDGSLITYNPQTHREISRLNLGGPLVSAPVVVGNRIVIGARDYLLYGVDVKSGTTAWRNSYWFSWIESTPTLADGVLYIGGSDYRRVTALEPETGRVRWATDVRGLSWGSPVVTNAEVYAGTCGQNIAGTVIKHRGGIVALDRESGAVRWRYDVPRVAGADFDGFVGSLVLLDGKLLGARVDGMLMAFPVP